MTVINKIINTARDSYYDACSDKCVKLESLKKFGKIHIYNRVEALVCFPGTIPCVAIATIVGVGAGIAAILSGNRSIRNFAKKYLIQSNNLLRVPYTLVLYIINPQADMKSNTAEGLTTRLVKDHLKNTARKCLRSDNFLKKHIGSRLTYALLALSCVVTRVVDGIIGLGAATLSLLALGTSAKLNQIALENLTTTGIILDLFECADKFINPNRRDWQQ